MKRGVNREVILLSRLIWPFRGGEKMSKEHVKSSVYIYLCPLMENYPTELEMLLGDEEYLIDEIQYQQEGLEVLKKDLIEVRAKMKAEKAPFVSIQEEL